MTKLFKAIGMFQIRGPGGIVAVELWGGLDSARRFMNCLSLITCAVRLGDAETLIQHPASMTRSSYTEAERSHHLISEGLE